MINALSPTKARILLDGLNRGSCSEWNRGILDWTLTLPGIGYVSVNDISRRITLNDGRGNPITYIIGRAQRHGGHILLSLSNGCTLMIPISEGR